MERIVIEVDDSTGEFYRSLSKEARQRFNQALSLMVKKKKNDETFADYSKFLDEIGNEAISNGLTAQTLEDLLTGND
jgi:predicted double-glycine peptidase